MSPIQKILFGSPGTGKSHKVHNEIIDDLGIENHDNSIIKTVFHPEYKYGDFMGKLMPFSDGDKVTYTYYAGHFLKALSQAYNNIILADDSASAENVILVIDEINRGNSSSIFGTAFQLLDREEDGWSSYELTLSDMEFIALLKLLKITTKPYHVKGNLDKTTFIFNNEEKNTPEDFIDDEILKDLIKKKEIKLPPNLSIVATMNTSDESIYYMDSAFKRRWDWEYVPIKSDIGSIEGDAFENDDDWQEFVDFLNTFILSNAKNIRKVEDKQIGYYFLKAPYSYEKIQNKLMFFLWDSVFQRDKKPLLSLIYKEDDVDTLYTFDTFTNKVEEFIKAIKDYK